MREWLAGLSGPTVTDMFDRCRDAVMAAGERLPSVSMRARTGVRWWPRHAAGLCGPDHTAGRRCRHTRREVTTAYIDAPDLMGRRGGLGTFVRMWQTLLSRCRGMGLCD